MSSGGWTRRLVYDGDALVAEYEPGGYMIHRYIHGNDAKADDPLIWYDNWNSGWRRALLTDHQGSIVQVADMYGNPVGWGGRSASARMAAIRSSTSPMTAPAAASRAAGRRPAVRCGGWKPRVSSGNGPA